MVKQNDVNGGDGEDRGKSYRVRTVAGEQIIQKQQRVQMTRCRSGAEERLGCELAGRGEARKAPGR